MRGGGEWGAYPETRNDVAHERSTNPAGPSGPARRVLVLSEAADLPPDGP